MLESLLKLVRPEILAMNAYQSARSEGYTGSIWLDANENPWDTSQVNQLNRYPEPQPLSLITLLSSLYKVNSNQILITRGIDEGIDLLVRLLCRAGKDQVMICPPTYGMYKVAATIQGAGIIEVPLVRENHFSLDVMNILQQWRSSIKFIFLCSPNNPTGNLLVTSDILFLCKKLDGKAIVVVDEAYVEFAMTNSLVKYINQYSNLVVLRTLSKAYGLAGIRCGTTIANSGIIQLLKKLIAPYPIPKSIVDIAYQQLKKDIIHDQLKIITQEREILTLFLKKLSFVKQVWPSQTNFLLFEVIDANTIMTACLNKGIVLRDRSIEPHLNNCIRITIGTPTENQMVMEVLSHV